jgi:hypothetical protein
LINVRLTLESYSSDPRETVVVFGATYMAPVESGEDEGESEEEIEDEEDVGEYGGREEWFD